MADQAPETETNGPQKGGTPAGPQTSFKDYLLEGLDLSDLDLTRSETGMRDINWGDAPASNERHVSTWGDAPGSL